ncbi:MAG: hypothetical protein CMP47_10915 [Rickettsiales bacterium]|nr:hypothetical protein [Rickettsiales bacterium]
MTKFYIAYAVNLMCLSHFLFRGGLRLSRFQIAITCIILLVPFLGTILYLLWYLWNPPPPAPHHLRQNSQNDFGKTEFLIHAHVDSKSYGLKPYKHVKLKPKKFDVEASDCLKTKLVLWAKPFRAFLGLLGIVLIITGVITLESGELSYANWRGLEVFAPASILIGVLLICLSIKKKKAV